MNTKTKHTIKTYGSYSEPVEQTKHTPTPWTLTGIKKQQIRCADKKARQSIIANMVAEWNYSSKTTYSLTDEANAQFIVKAVNSHDELIEALKEALGWFEHNKLGHRIQPLIKQALAKAEG